MKPSLKIVAIWIVCFFVLIFASQAIAQTEDELHCYFSEDTTESILESIPVLQDTSLRTAVLFVQFADWETNIRARGSVGWESSTNPDSFKFDKYRYHHFWDMYFSKSSYSDDPNSPPAIHPDHESHSIRVYGSFRDYWWEVSHKNLAIKPAVTHPDSTQLDTASIFYSGIINNYNPADSSIIWVTLDKPLADYYSDPNDTLHTNPFWIMPAALAKAYTL